MPFVQDVGSEPRGVRTMRVAMIAGAIGSLIGGAVVIASVATVLTVTNPQPKQTSITSKSQPPTETTGVATPAEKVVTADTNACANQTWPNIESRCLKRVDDADQQTPPANQAPAANEVPTTTAGTAPAELQPGSPALPAPSAVLQPQSVAAPPAQPAVQAVTPPEQVAPVAEAPARTAAPSKPVRKADRTRRPPKAVARQADDDDDQPAVTAARRTGPRSHPDDVVVTERSTRSRFVARQPAEPADDVVIEHPRRLLSPFGFFGALFGADNN